jgi:hypothetical protein
MLKQLVHGLSTLAGKGLVARRRQQLVSAERQANEVIATVYHGIYSAQNIYAPIAVVVAAVQEYAERELHAWRSQDPRIAADGCSAQFRYVQEFTQVFNKGQLGSPFKPLSISGNQEDSDLRNRMKTAPAAVKYRLWLEIHLKAVPPVVETRVVAREEIDPNNESPDVATGKWSAPSWMTVRCDGDPAERLLSHLARSVPQDRPTLNEWVKWDEARNHPAIVRQVEMVASAERALHDAEARLARQRGGK